MAALKTPFLGAFYVARSSNQADEQAINVFLELDEEKQGKAPGMLLQTPGLGFLLNLSLTSPVSGPLLAESGQSLLSEGGTPLLPG